MVCLSKSTHKDACTANFTFQFSSLLPLPLPLHCNGNGNFNVSGKLWEQDVINYPAHHPRDQPGSDRWYLCSEPMFQLFPPKKGDKTLTPQLNPVFRHLPMQRSATMQSTSKGRRGACGNHQVPLHKGGRADNTIKELLVNHKNWVETRFTSSPTTSPTWWWLCLDLRSPQQSFWYKRET